MADIRRDWLTNQNTDCCFAVIGSVHDNPTVLCSKAKNKCSSPNWSALLALSGGQRILINIRGQYSIQKNIYTSVITTQS